MSPARQTLTRLSLQKEASHLISYKSREDIWVGGHFEVRVSQARQTLIRLGLQEESSHLISNKGRRQIWVGGHLEVRHVSGTPDFN